MARKRRASAKRRSKTTRTRRSPEAALAELKARLREISDLGSASAVLSWDQATYMPEGGADARGRQMAMLSRHGARAFGRAGDRQIDRDVGPLRRRFAERQRRCPADPRGAARLRESHQGAGRIRRARQRAWLRLLPGLDAGAAGRTTSRGWCHTWRRRSISAANIRASLRPTSTSPIRSSTMPTKA